MQNFIDSRTPEERDNEPKGITTMTQQNFIEEKLKEFDEKFSYANFTWNGDNKTGVRSAKDTKKEIKSFLSTTLHSHESNLKEELRGNVENIFEELLLSFHPDSKGKKIETAKKDILNLLK